MTDEYEVISYYGINYKFSTVSAIYCAPHIHKEIEIGMVLEGKFKVRSCMEQTVLTPGSQT